MASLQNKKNIIILAIVSFAFLGGFWWYFQYLEKNNRETEIIPREASTTISLIPKEKGEIINTETVICANETYIFDTVMLDYGFYNDIYKTSHLPENFIVRIKAPRGGGGVFSVLAVPQRNCDRIYLLTAIQETDAQEGLIFEWKIGDKSARELAVSEKFWGRYVPHPRAGKEFISQDGEEMLVAQTGGPATGEQCNLRNMYLLNLREDTSKLLVQLSETESFNNSGFFDDFGYCGSLDFGWQDESTIYYSIYKATDEWSRPFIERRILRIE